MDTVYFQRKRKKLLLCSIQKKKLFNRWHTCSQQALTNILAPIHSHLNHFYFKKKKHHS